MKFLFCGSRFYRFNQGIVSALRGLGQEVRLLEYEDIRFQHTRSLYPYLRIKARRRFQAVNARIRREVEREPPDVFFALGGNIVFPETLLWMKERGITPILWLLDLMAKLPITRQGLAFYRLVYTFEPGDLGELSRHNPRAAYLPPAFDPAVYRPLAGEPPVHDLLFVGNPFGRLDLLQRLSVFAAGRGIRLGLVGRYWSRHNPGRRALFFLRCPELHRCVLKNGSLDPLEVNVLYNRAKINLNIHRSRSFQGVNPRLFDIAGAGAFQLVDEMSTLPAMFSPGTEVVTWSGADDLEEKIVYYLERKELREQFARSAHRRAHDEHTYRHRMEKVLSDIRPTV